MNKLLLLIFSLFFIGDVHANVVKMNLSQAVKINMVSVTAETTGQSYRGRALQLKFENKGGSTIQLTVDKGSIFTSLEEGYQPLLSAGDELITLRPFAAGQTTVQTFCADAGLRAPVKGLAYQFSHKAGDTLIRLLEYIKENRLYDALGQDAVWAITNNHSLEEVFEPYRDVHVKKLIPFMAMITGRPEPEYHKETVMNETPGEVPYSPKALKIHAKFEHILDKPAVLTLGVFNEQGEVVQEVFSNRRFKKAGHRFTVTFEASDVPAGKYYIRLKEEDAVLKEQMVLVE